MEAPTLNHHPQPNHKDVWFLILIGVIAVMFMVILNSCVTQKQRERILKDCVTSSSRKDSVALIIQERLIPYVIHDSIPYLLPNPCSELCDSLGRLKHDFKATITSDKGTKISLSVKNNKLSINDNLNGLKGVVKTKDTTEKHYTTIKEQVRDNCKLDHLTKWDSFQIIGFRILAGLIALFVGFKLLQKKI